MNIGSVIQLCVIIFTIGGAYALLQSDVSFLKKEAKTSSDNYLALKLYIEKKLTKTYIDFEAKFNSIEKRLDQHDKILGVGKSNDFNWKKFKGER